VALDGRWEWLAVAVAGAAKYVTVKMDADPQTVGTVVYAVAAGAVLAGCVLRRRARRRRYERQALPTWSVGTGP
jgi:hypothetical protein